MPKALPADGLPGRTGLTASYICPTCDVDFGYPQGLTIHKELGCEWGDAEDGGTKYCCGMIYEDGESTCSSCGEPL